MARLKVDSIRNRNDDGPPSLPKGTVPAGGTLGVNGDISVTGISTVGFLTTQHVTTGVVTTSFVGDGSGLTSLQTTTASKATREVS